jgi:hypothetical protein
MPVYLEDHPPARRQYRAPRRSDPTGAIVLHTAENVTDVVLPDAGAENVAAFIARRGDPGSYHTIVDSDSIVRVGRYEWEMFHEGTGGNRWSLGLSFACRAAQWPMLPEEWVEPALRNGAEAAADMARWLHTEHGIMVPAARITADAYRRGVAGFVGHAALDPGRRSDPGAHFPWARFLSYYAETLVKETPMTTAKQWSIVDLDNVMNVVRDLFLAYRRGAPTVDAAEATEEAIWDWGRDLARKLIRHEDPGPTLEYIEWALRTEQS